MRIRAPRNTSLAAALVGLALLASSHTGSATVVERVVAVVGEQAILLSDLRQRAKPVLARVYQQTPPGAQRAAATSQVYKEVLERMVEEELERRAANQARITITAKEIDDAIVRVARQNKVSVDKLIGEALSSGMTEAEYRSELRRQLLEAKLMNLRIAGRIRITEEDLKSSYRAIVMEERKKLAFRTAWIMVNIPAGADDAGIAKARAEAKRIASEARSGTDFGKLAKQYSVDVKTKGQGGLLPRQLPSQLPKDLRAAVMNLELGDVSDPVRLGGTFVVLKLVERTETELPSYEEARNQLQGRVYMEKMAKARDHWLRTLRKRTHVEVRL
ncbi:MAG: peptidylprolyl isomerase [Polyangiaceae bacterium]